MAIESLFVVRFALEHHGAHVCFRAGATQEVLRIYVELVFSCLDFCKTKALVYPVLS